MKKQVVQTALDYIPIPLRHAGRRVICREIGSSIHFWLALQCPLVHPHRWHPPRPKCTTEGHQLQESLLPRSGRTLHRLECSARDVHTKYTFCRVRSMFIRIPPATARGRTLSRKARLHCCCSFLEVLQPQLPERFSRPQDCHRTLLHQHHHISTKNHVEGLQKSEIVWPRLGERRTEAPNGDSGKRQVCAQASSAARLTRGSNRRSPPQQYARL